MAASLRRSVYPASLWAASVFNLGMSLKFRQLQVYNTLKKDLQSILIVKQFYEKNKLNEH